MPRQALLLHSCGRHSLLMLCPVQTYLLKFAKSGEEGDKVFLLLESGTRLHTTEARVQCPLMLRRALVHGVTRLTSQALVDKSDQPSNFALKLRKHLRTRRLDDVRQLGVLSSCMSVSCFTASGS